MLALAFAHLGGRASQHRIFAPFPCGTGGHARRVDIMSGSLVRRVTLLEQTGPAPSASCFWCECKRPTNADPLPPRDECPHQDWKRIPHEQALAELT
jgi:hypothetical protein